MKLKRWLCTALVCVMAVGCLCVTTGAVEPRATQEFNIEIPANTFIKANTSFPLDVGESVAIRATYLPRLADLDFGLVAPDGKFHYLTAEDGVINQAFDVSKRGDYYLAFRNNSSYTVSISGNVNY